MMYILVLLLTIIGASLTEGACPVRGCMCTTSGDIMCGGHSLSRIPTINAPRPNQLRKIYGELQLGRNNIREIPAGAFDNIKMKHLALWHNPIGDNISPQGLRGLDDTLVTIDMEDCDLENLPTGLFNHLKKLRMIELGSNRISQLTEGFFEGAGDLWSISLKRNKIQQVARNWFRGLSKLAEIDFQNNEIAGIASGAFDGLTKLKRLHLEGNKLSTIVPGMMNGLGNLQELYLQNNPLRSIADNSFSQASNLKTLNMTETGIGQLRANMFNGLGKLQKLHLGMNNLRSFPQELYKMMSSLNHLELNNNSLPSIGSGCAVRQLEFSENAPGYNDFNMNIAGNPFSCTCAMEWVREFVQFGGRISGECKDPGSFNTHRLGRSLFEECPTPMCMP